MRAVVASGRLPTIVSATTGSRRSRSTAGTLRITPASCAGRAPRGRLDRRLHEPLVDRRGNPPRRFVQCDAHLLDRHGAGIVRMRQIRTREDRDGRTGLVDDRRRDIRDARNARVRAADTSVRPTRCRRLIVARRARQADGPRAGAQQAGPRVVALQRHVHLARCAALQRHARADANRDVSTPSRRRRRQ